MQAPFSMTRGIMRDEIEKLIGELPDGEGLLALSYLTGASPGELRRQKEAPEEAVIRKYREIVKKRRSGEPLQYALGVWDFYGRTFHVDARALIPRPETERLVERVLEENLEDAVVVDVGTGSGIIAITLAEETGYFQGKKKSPQKIYGLDISPEALSLARENEKSRNPAEKTEKMIQWMRSDLLQSLDAIKGKIHCIVSNPPYIDPKEKEHLQPELFYEPSIALYAGNPGDGGLAIYERLIRDSAQYLAKGGLLAMEIGDEQGKAVSGLLRRFHFHGIEIHPDYTGRDRVAVGRAQEE